MTLSNLGPPYTSGLISGLTSSDYNTIIQSEYRYPTTNREDNPNLGPSNGYRDPTYRRDVEVRILLMSVT